MANEIKLSGWKEFQGKLKNAPSQVITKCDAIVEDEARRWSGLAKRSAPKNFGKLAGQIQAVKTATMQAEVVSPISYSPYMEWGTGTRVSVPSDLANYAIQFKGQRQTIGVHPHAYFFIHKPNVEKSTFSRIDKALTTPL